VSLRLAGLALEHWAELDGYAVAHNMPPLPELPLDRFNSFVWWFFTRNADDPKEVEKFRLKLWRPPPHVVPTRDSPWSAENETAAFSGLKAALSPGKPR
jgi:hypothetical protein